MRTLLASLSLVLILVAFSVMIATTATFAQLVESFGNTTQTRTTNETESPSELAQAIAQVVQVADADLSCDSTLNTCANIIHESPSRIVITGDLIHTFGRVYNVQHIY